jgi:hypothetical protein
MESQVSRIAPAFIKAKRAFGPALKDKTNPAFKSRYADLGACLEAVDDALLANGIAVYQETFEDPTGVTVETVFLHESGETIRSGRLHVPASKQDPQGYGSALTYCRRYSLMAACGIAPEDDDGNAAARPVQRPAPPVAKPVVDVDSVITAMREADDLDALKEIFGPAYKKASDAEKFALKTAYESIKGKFTKETA